MNIGSRDPEEMHDIREDVEYHDALNAAEADGGSWFSLDEFRARMVRRRAAQSPTLVPEADDNLPF